MSEPSRFLHAFAHALAVATLYPDGHTTRERAVDSAYRDLDALTSLGPPSFTFLEDEVIFGVEPLRDLRSWDWSRRLMAAGIQRLEFERRISREEFEGFLQEILARLTLSTIDTADNRQMRTLGVRFGAVTLAGQSETEPRQATSATLGLSMTDEVETLSWLHSEVSRSGTVPIFEAEAVVRSLSVAMRGDRHLLLPLLQLKEFDQYTTTHSLNVSVLSMGLAESIGLDAAQVRAVGVAGLLHDIGKTLIPLEVLTKPGRLSDEERQLMNRHPIDGARIVLQSEDDLEMAAVVAYEHHIMLDGGGYPSLHYNRACTTASRLVHVCDVYDALCTKRPYRDAWPSEKTEAYLLERSGTEFDPDLVQAFLRMIRTGRMEISVLES